MRVEKFLMKKLRNVPRSHIFKLVRTGKVRLNGKTAKLGAMLVEGDELELFIPAARFEEDTLPKAKLGVEDASSLPAPEIIYEDEHILAVNKPSGLAVHGGKSGEEKDNLTLRVQNYLGALFANSIFKPSLAHRLDRETSGIILFGKRRDALKRLASELRERRVEKKYLALLIGKPPAREGKIGAPVVRRDGGKTRELKDSVGVVKTAVTLYKVIANYGEYTLVELKPLTGRTHQLRAHCRHIGCPIAGDAIYGNREANKFLKKKFGLSRLFLHAESLSFTHPATEDKTNLKAPLPNELNRILAQLKRYK